MRRAAVILTFLIALLCTPARALEMREARWGFDGNVVPGRFNLLSVRLSNPGDTTFDGPAELHQRGAPRGEMGTPVLQRAFVSPHSAAWLQFTVWVAPGRDEFVLRCDRDEFRISPAPMGPPAQVIFSADADQSAPGPRLPAFPSTLFPTSVAATDGLDAIALDAMPRWDARRSEAFIDWLRRGGTAIVLPLADGSFAEFTGPLSPLNVSAERTPIGGGTIVRGHTPRRMAGAALFQDHGVARVNLEHSFQPIVGELDHALLQGLAQLTRPNIRWSVIGAFTLCYVLLIGPVHYFWGRRLDYRLSLGAFAGCVALFSFLLSVAGRRGYGEVQSVHSVSIARALAPGRFDVAQWTSAFATRGSVYRLTHTAAENFYAVPAAEPVRQHITNGSDGFFLADIPLYSSRQFLHRAVMSGPDTTVSVQHWEENDSRLAALTLIPGAGFPRAAVEIRARFRDRFYRLDLADDRITLAAGPQGLGFDEFLPRSSVAMAQTAIGAIANRDGKIPDDTIDQLLPLIVLQALDGHEHLAQFVARGAQPADRLELLIFAAAPESFHLRGEGFGRENGRALFIQEVRKPLPAR